MNVLSSLSGINLTLCRNFFHSRSNFHCLHTFGLLFICDTRLFCLSANLFNSLHTFTANTKRPQLSTSKICFRKSSLKSILYVFRLLLNISQQPLRSSFHGSWFIFPLLIGPDDMFEFAFSLQCFQLFLVPWSMTRDVGEVVFVLSSFATPYISTPALYRLAPGQSHPTC